MSEKKIPMQFRLAPDVAAAIREAEGPQSVLVERAVRAFLKQNPPGSNLADPARLDTVLLCEIPTQYVQQAPWMIDRLQTEMNRFDPKSFPKGWLEQTLHRQEAAVLACFEGTQLRMLGAYKSLLCEDGSRSLLLWACVGTGITRALFRETARLLDEFAQAHEFSRIEFVGRKGWARWLRNSGWRTMTMGYRDL